MIERARSIREWSCSGLGSCFVSACEADKRFLFPVVPYPYRDGAIRFFETTSLTVIHKQVLRRPSEPADLNRPYAASFVFDRLGRNLTNAFLADPRLSQNNCDSFNPVRCKLAVLQNIQ
jgi:hypothetical protein